MPMYAVTATVTKGGITRQVPAFLLGSTACSESNAETLAREIVNPTKDPDCQVSVCAVEFGHMDAYLAS